MPVRISGQPKVDCPLQREKTSDVGTNYIIRSVRSLYTGLKPLQEVCNGAVCIIRSTDKVVRKIGALEPTVGPRASHKSSNLVPPAE